MLQLVPQCQGDRSFDAICTTGGRIFGILSVIVCECETWFLTLPPEQRNRGNYV